MNDDLPDGWTSAALGVVAEVNPRHQRDLDDDLMVTFVPMPDVSESDWKLEATKERPLREVKTGYTHFAEGDVLFAKITPCMENGKAAVATHLRNGLGCGTTELHVLRPHDGIDAKYLYHFIHQESFRREAANNFTGTAGQLRVPVDFMRGAGLPLAPTAEQRRIITKLDALLAKAQSSQERLDKVPTIIRRFRQSVLNTACDGRLTADWRAQHETTSAKERWGLTVDPLDAPELPEIPVTWVWRRLDDFSLRVSVGHVGPTTQFYCSADVGVPFVRSQNVRPMRLVMEDVQYITREFHESLKKSQLQPEDILIVRVGANRGNTCRVPAGIGTLNCANIVFARPYPGISNYVELYCQSKLGQGLLLEMTTGSAQGVLNTKAVADLPVPLPPEEEQAEMVRRVEGLFAFAARLQARYEQAKTHVDRLTQSVLAKAFRGELVPTEAELARREGREYETAEELLARLKTAPLAARRNSKAKSLARTKAHS
jgi:type I restriction enzyme S subunit